MTEKTTSSQRPTTRAERRQAMVKDKRQERMKQYQRNRREMQIIKLTSVVLALVVVGAIAFAGFNYLQDRDLNQEPAGVVKYTYEAANHIEGDIDYSTQPEYQGELPPAGGAHNNTAQQCDVYDAPIRPENAIHSLEHGAVWITYQPSLPQDQIDNLRGVADGDNYIMMSPDEGLPAPIVLTAWNHQLSLQSYDSDLVQRFLRSYKNKRGVTPEFGASCAGTNMTVPTT
jgi:hypothetical protein